MTEAKVPDSKSDWKSIDIFLFSNGQQSSPPRKYHLVTDQLGWWKATLNYLANAQYGSTYNTIELYSIDGKKVETPLQLSHNTAYVAVAPSDYFIDAGYGKYLIKATRSWEKSQLRKSSNTADVLPEPQILNDTFIPDDKDNVSVNIKDTRDESVTLKTIVASIVDNEPSVIVKPEPGTEKHVNNNSSSSYPIKQTEKVIRTPIQHTTTINKITNSLTSPPRIRKPSLKRRDSVKINTDTTKNQPPIIESNNNKVPTRINTDTTKNQPPIIESNNNKVPTRNKIYKPMQKKLSTLPVAVLSKVEETVNEIRSSSSIKIDNHPISQKKTAETENVARVDENISIPQIFNNSYSEKPPILMNPEIPPSSNSDNNNQSVLYVNRQGAVHELFDRNQYDKTDNDNDSLNAISLLSKLNAYNPPSNEKDLFSPPAVSTVTKSDSNTGINKEGIVNLKLNIEIWNNPNESKAASIALSQKGSLEVLKTEKGSQVDIKEKSLEPDKPLHNLFANETNEANHGLIIVDYMNHNDNTPNTFPVQTGNSNFLIFLPVLKLNGCKRCDCKEEPKQVPIPSIGNPIKKASCLSVHIEKVEKVVSHTEILSKNDPTAIQSEANSLHDKNELTLVKRKSVAIKEDEIESPTARNQNEVFVEESVNALLSHQEPEKTELIVLKKESTGVLQKTMNKFTQTYWCDVLWEARLQNDGHYSFHMPTLETIKYNKL